MSLTKDTIKINIVGKIFTTKSFNIKEYAKIIMVKKLILSRLKLNGNEISPTLNECKLITENNICLDDTKTVSQLIDEQILYDGCNLSIEINLVLDCGKKLSYNSLLVDNKLEFGKTNMEEESYNVRSLVQSNNRQIPLKPVNKRKNIIPKGNYSLAWDNNPIDDSDWYN
jgi:hypothetical protein